MESFIIDENPILFAGRVVIKLTFPGELVQPFYLSTGRHSGRQGVWFPFDGANVIVQWFHKSRYSARDDEGNELPLHRFGSEQLKEISDFLSVLDVSSAKEVFTLEEVNQYLFGSDDIAFEKLCNLL